MKHLPVLLVIFLFILGCGQTAKELPKSKPTLPTISIKASDLAKAYKENELAADAKYKGQSLEVTGKVSDISETLGNVQVSLTGSDFLSVSCSFNEPEKAQVAKLKTEQNVTLQGTGDGMTLNLYVGLTDCTIK